MNLQLPVSLYNRQYSFQNIYKEQVGTLSEISDTFSVKFNVSSRNFVGTL